MSFGNRALFVLLAGVSAAAIGCSGGGGGGGGGTVPTVAPTHVTAAPTATPTSVATPTPTHTAGPTASPTASPTPQSTSSAIPVSTRPLHTGDTFAYAGSSLESFVYSGVTPNPSGTVAASVAQSVTDEGPTPFDGATPFDLRTVETDTQQSPAKTIGVTTDSYYASGPYLGSQTGYYTYGFASSDTEGQHITDTMASVGDHSGTFNGLVDVLPETLAQTWTNTGAQTIAESESDGFTANRTVNADGSYVENDTYPQTSQFTPPPAPLTATITENSSGSGTYVLPLEGPPNSTFSYATPSAGNITISLSQPGEPTVTNTVATWYALPLYTETDRDDGALAIPGSCNVPAQFGARANGIEQTFTRVDTVLGTLENFDQITYVVGGYAVCIRLTDTTDVFYDYSGQGDQPPFGFSFSGGQSPLEVITTTSTVGLTSTSVTGAFRTRDATSEQAVAGAALARTSFLAALERRRFERRHQAFQRLRAAHVVRAHR